MCLTDRHDVTLAVKVTLNFNTTNQLDPYHLFHLVFFLILRHPRSLCRFILHLCYQLLPLSHQSITEIMLKSVEGKTDRGSPFKLFNSHIETFIMQFVESRIACTFHLFNSLPNDKFLDWSKLKAFADNKINET